MKKAVMSIAFVLVITLLLISSVSALDNQKSYSWYCVRNKEHKQPSLDHEISFIEEYDVYHVDKNHGDECSEKIVYLTFDAGYENGNIEKILDILKAEQVPGAFFILGNLIVSNPNLIHRMVKEGHTVCNHTYSHKNMTNCTESEFLAELSRLEKAYWELIGEKMPKYYRPPEGAFSRNNLQYASRLGYKTVFWSFAYADWDNNKQMKPDAAREKILSNIHNGAVLLLHPTSSTNVAILSDVIREMKTQGYGFGTLDQLTA